MEIFARACMIVVKREPWGERRMQHNWERPAIFVFGVLFLIVSLIIAVAIPDPTPTQYYVFRTALAASITGILVLVPGSLEVKGYQKLPANGKLGLVAGGSVAIFIIVYLLTPALIQAPPEVRVREATAKDIEFAYNAVYGPPPRDMTPPLQGVRIGSIPRYRDAKSGKSLTAIFETKAAKVILPYYARTKCPRYLLTSRIFAQFLSRYLSKPVDLLYLNIGPYPTQAEVRDFHDTFGRYAGAHLLVGGDSERKEIGRSFFFIYQEAKGPNDEISVNHSTSIFLFMPDGKPGWVVDDENQEEVAKGILYHLANTAPQYLNLSLIAEHLPRTAGLLVPAAYADPRQSDLGKHLGAVREEQTRAYVAHGGKLNCDHSH